MRRDILFADRIKQLRKKQNLTQQELADLLCVSRSTISKWETKSAYPDILTLIEISSYFSVTLDYLLKEDMDMTEQLDTEIKRGRITMKWYIELPLFALAFFGVTVIFNTLFNLRFNFVTELFTALVFYGVYKYLGRKNGDNKT